MSPAWRSVRGGRLILVTTCLIVVVLLFVFVVVVPHHSSALHSAISVSYTSVASLLRRRPAPAPTESPTWTDYSRFPNISVLERTTRERDDISRYLNVLQERHQQLVCQVGNQSGLSQTGGWCDVAVNRSHTTDIGLAAALASLFQGRSVVGLGDGLGVYRKLILNTGKVATYDAFDGAPNIHDITHGQVKFLDLTLPQYWLPRYDWVLSLEVLEHIPAQYESIVLDNINRAAGHGVVLSWAVPGQPGRGHVNCRSLAYAERAMSDRGFALDNSTSVMMRAQATPYYLRNNIMVFIRRQ